MKVQNNQLLIHIWRVWTGHCPANTKHLYNIHTILDQRRRRCIDAIQMFCVCWLTIKVGGDVPLTLMF